MTRSNSMRAVMTATLIICAFSVFLLVSGDRANADTPLEFGISVDGDRNALLTAAEDQIDRKFDVVRSFYRWEEQFPSNNDLQLLDDRKALISIKPTRSNGFRIPWANIAAARPGDQLYQEMVDWAEALRPYEDQIWITFHHEPEAESNRPNGNAAEFIAAWRNFMTIMDANDFDPLGRLWVMTDYSFQLRESDRRFAAKWYPGDAWVEGIAADAYNWYDCREGVEIDWLTLEQIIEGVRLFGQQHPNEELMLAEFGSAEDPQRPQRKAEWFQDAQELFSQPGYEQFTTVSYFSLHHLEGNFDCDWRFTSSSPSTDAFSTFANDPRFGGNGPVAPPPPPPAPDCVATVTGNGIRLDWSEPGTPVIRRNGAWVTTLTAGTTTYFDASPPQGASYEVIVHRGIRSQLDCEFAGGTPPTPPPTAASCSATVSGNSVILSWDIDGTPVVRRNGSWLATPPATARTFTDNNPPTNPTYAIRTRTGQTGPIDTACTLTGPPLPPPAQDSCTATSTANGVTLDWTISGEVQVRRNGHWLRTVTNSQTTTDAAGRPTDNYVLRTWGTGSPVDYRCIR